MISFDDKEKQIPEEFKSIAKEFAEKGFITTSTDNLIIGKKRLKKTLEEKLKNKY